MNLFSAGCDWTRKVFSSSLRHKAALVTTLLAAAWGGPAAVPSQPVALEPLASAPSPPSMASWLTLLASGSACVVESYWYRVVCIDPDGKSVEFGTEGEGPGEFRSPHFTIRGASGAIGVLDLRLHRLSMFSAAGEFIASTGGLPSGFRPTRRTVLDGTVLGLYRGFDGNVDRPLAHAEINVATGRVEWERAFPNEGDIVSCTTPLTRVGRLAPGEGSGDLLSLACHGEFLVWYADRDAEEPTAIVRSPTYVERYPTDEDVASELRMLGPLPRAPGEDEIRARPKQWYGPRVLDDRRRFWAVSHWNAAADVIPALSYIDLFRLADDGPEYALTLQVRDKVMGMDVLGDTLAVLVERDAGGVIPERRIDWYDISGVADPF